VDEKKPISSPDESAETTPDPSAAPPAPASAEPAAAAEPAPPGPAPQTAEVAAGPAAVAEPRGPAQPGGAADLSPVMDSLEPSRTEVERRSRLRLYVVAGVAVAVVALVAGAIFWCLSLVNEEDSEWLRAETGHSEESWRGYVRWAAGVREGGGLRATAMPRLTTMDVRAPAAAAHALLASAEAAVAQEDWDALCALVREHAGSEAAARALKGLNVRIDRGAAAYRNVTKNRETPELAANAVVAALEAARANPCGGGAVIRVTHAVEPGAGLDEQVREGRSVADVLGAISFDERDRALAEAVARELRETTGGALAARYAPPGDDATGLLDVRVTATLASRDRFLTPSGRQLPGVALRVRVEVSAPSLPAEAPLPGSDSWQTSEATLPPSFGMEFFRGAGATGEQTVEGAYAHAVDLLYPHLGEHLRGVLGVARFVRQYRSSGSCGTVAPLPANRVVRGNTRDGIDGAIGSCTADDPEYDEYGEDYDGSDEPQETELVYRVVLPERSVLEVAADTDFAAVLYIRRECSVASTEVACSEDGRVVATLDAGVYYVFVDTAEDESPGQFSVYAAVRAPAAAGRACSAATALGAGVEVSGSTTGGTDALSGSCGGVGAPERVYAVDLPDRSRVRCSLRSDTTASLYLLPDCADPETELACSSWAAPGTTTVTALDDRGRVHVVADGFGFDDRGAFDLRCELAPAAGGTGATADACATAGTIAGPGPLEIDTFLARDDLRGSCGVDGTADVVYRLDVAAPSRLRVAWGDRGLRGVLYVQRACGQRETEVACAREGQALAADLAPGTYFLVADGASPPQFGAARLTIELDDLNRLCAEAPQLRPGEVVRANTGRAQSRFHGQCAGVIDSSEALYRLVIDRRSHVTLRAQAEIDAVLYVRRACTSLEVGCSLRDHSTRLAVFEADLDPGQYYVFVDASSGGRAFELSADVRPSE
jgi:hypothetical protein